MKYWIITDTHFGHAKIKDFCGRPGLFEIKILRNIVDIVKNEDIFIHLGDVCWGKDEAWHRKLNLAIPWTRKWLIKGNHDKKTNSWYINHGWHFVGDSIQLNMFGRKILLSHRPQSDGDFDINVHGHLHNTGHHSGFDDDKHVSFFIEHDYMPVDLRKLVGK